ncbi:MAG TPA: EAL domain-containing protein [Longimicrobium sp.]|nr:EAL domain-containing protein [Longimicrobium sp.]
MPHRFRTLFQHTGDAVCLADAEGVIVEANPAATTRFGLAADARGHLRDLFADPTDWAGVARRLERGEDVHMPVRLRAPSGAPVVESITCVQMRDGPGAQIQAIVHAVHNPYGGDLHELYDGHTGLPNRAAFVTQLTRTLQSPAHRGSPLAVMHVDLNRFHRINESLGHETGTTVLSMTAQRLDACLRPGDVVARGSGDDFLVLLKDFVGEAEVVRVAERIARMLTGGYAVGEHEVFCGSDVGVALGEGGAADADTLLRAAETAMSSARRTGRVQVFRPEMRTDAVQAMRMDTDLRHALERGELRVFYQPVVGLRDGRVHGFEALVRWEHPVRGLVSPADFIPVAEDTDLIIPIGEWVLREAALQLRDWQGRYPEHPLGMGVNLSVRQFRPALVQQVRTVLEHSGVDPAGLKLEVTESVVMADADDAIAILHQLKELGIKLQVDDFGTGYSSLSYLHRLPVDILKIDRSLVVAMPQGTKHVSIVRAIIALANTLALETTAEGVEDAEQADNLREMGCTHAQGYLWSRPVPAAQAEPLITAPPLTR